MRGVHSVVDDLRLSVFEEVARLAYEGGDYTRIDKIPYKIVPGEVAQYRDSVFRERAIVVERLRLACGLSVRPASEFNLPSMGIEEASVPEKYYEPPLVNIIPFACNACPPSEIRVSSNCQGCLSHPCMNICPKGAIEVTREGKSFINKDKCIRCGKCINQCPYNAISRLERPCAKACGMDAIGSDEYGRAKIDYSKCVSCGQCLVNCPFGAIADKSQIFQLIQAIRSGEEVIACLAPAFAGQYKNATTPKIRKAMRILGFKDTVEVAIGADLCAVDEAEDFLRKVPAEQPFMGTSCCPAWSVMAKKTFPQFADYISMALTPMVITARIVRKDHPNAKIVFVGPCSAKKLEASRKSVRSEVDFVLTFEELKGMFRAKDIDFETLEADPEDVEFAEGSEAGRKFAVAGGVAGAVKEYLSHAHPEVELLSEQASGLKDCKKMLMMAKAGKRNGYLLEGMACPGGCVSGAGTCRNVTKVAASVTAFAASAEKKSSEESAYLDMLEDVLNDEDKESFR